ncbi:hypothetical protein G8A07_22355 [Roseateles sp. DAIF2]|nr:hypothetical protein [Roseateles sp. DAIF2]QPF75390.1 hypothetical protein G8A07_22355 [Roseateles sp. DAIF2]
MKNLRHLGFLIVYPLVCALSLALLPLQPQSEPVLLSGDLSDLELPPAKG